MKLWDPAQKRLAKAVFNRPARLLLAAWVLEREAQPFSQQEAALSVATYGEAPSAVVQELQRFTEWGMLERSEPAPGERRVLYSMRKESRLWEVFRAAVSVFDLEGEEEERADET